MHRTRFFCPSSQHKRQLGKISNTWLIALALLLAYALTWAMFLAEGHPKIVQKGDVRQAIPIVLHVMGADLLKDSITVTVVPDVASASLAVGKKLVHDVDVELDTGSAQVQHHFKKGEPPIPWVTTLAIDDGDLTEFPFDRYLGRFTVKAGIDGGAKGPVNLEIDKIVHGFTFAAVGEPSSEQADLEVEFTLTRSPAVLFLSIMAMISLTIVVLSALYVAWQVATQNRTIEFSMLVWAAALLFVIPAVRTGIPGSPPAGALIDVALFFWLHVLDVIALLTLVATWSRSAKKAS